MNENLLEKLSEVLIDMIPFTVGFLLALFACWVVTRKQK